MKNMYVEGFYAFLRFQGIMKNHEKREFGAFEINLIFFVAKSNF